MLFTTSQMEELVGGWVTAVVQLLGLRSSQLPGSYLVFCTVSLNMAQVS